MGSLKRQYAPKDNNQEKLKLFLKKHKGVEFNKLG